MEFTITRIFVSFLTIWVLQLGWIEAVPVDTAEVEFIILHNNDMHARFEQTNLYTERCPPEDVASNKCYGGFARLAHEIQKFREEAKQPGGTPVLYLNAGDTFSGTSWFYVFKANITTDFMDALKPDAISLGNHEFDDGIEGLVPFLEKANYPVLVSNLDLTTIPALAETKSLRPSTILDVSGTKVGVIGYLTNETAQLSLSQSLSFTSEIDAINKEAKLLEQQGVNIIIALGHSGFEIDQQIALECPLVDLVIGGHTNTFLYNGNPPDIETPVGPYPKVIMQASGKRVPVVQAYAYTKYLGQLRLKFDGEGNLINWEGNPILLTGSIPQDPNVIELLEHYRPALVAEEETVIGHSKVLLDGSNCRESECNLGNMIADSMVYVRTIQYLETNDDFWSDTAIAFLQGGVIRSTISKKDNGEITRLDLMEVLPFDNKLIKLEVIGKTIRNMLTLSSSRLGYGFGGFLQMSGAHVVYDADEPSDARVKSIQVLCAQCNIPQYQDLDDEKHYNIIVSDYLASGGDGYDIPTLSQPQPLGIGDLKALEDYIKARSPVFPGVEWRIRILGEVMTTPSATSSTTPSTGTSPGTGTTPGTSTTEEGGDDGVGYIAASGLLLISTLLLHVLR